MVSDWGVHLAWGITLWTRSPRFGGKSQLAQWAAHHEPPYGRSCRAKVPWDVLEVWECWGRRLGGRNVCLYQVQMGVPRQQMLS